MEYACSLSLSLSSLSLSLSLSLSWTLSLTNMLSPSHTHAFTLSFTHSHHSSFPLSQYIFSFNVTIPLSLQTLLFQRLFSLISFLRLSFFNSCAPCKKHACRHVYDSLGFSVLLDSDPAAIATCSSKRDCRTKSQRGCRNLQSRLRRSDTDDDDDGDDGDDVSARPCRPFPIYLRGQIQHLITCK